MDIRMIATDLDGTLLNPEGNISARTLNALHACTERNIPVVMASGRTFEGIRLLAKSAGINAPIISSNGARVDASPYGPTLLEDTLSPALAREVFDILKQSGLYIECYSGNVIYQAHAELSPFLKDPAGYEEVPAICDEDGYEQHFINDINRMEQEGMNRAYKFAAFCREQERLDEIRRKMAHLPVSINSSFPFNIEIMEQGRGKGRAIRFLAEHMGISVDQVMAFGDGTNDREMLAAAGTGVAMANAADELKEIASMIAPSNREDGLAQLIEQYVLC